MNFWNSAWHRCIHLDYTLQNSISNLEYKNSKSSEKITSYGHTTMKSKILYIHPAAATVYLFTECMVWEQVYPDNIMQCLCWTIASKHSLEQQEWKSILFMFCSRHQINWNISYLAKKKKPQNLSTARQPCYSDCSQVAFLKFSCMLAQFEIVLLAWDTVF